MGDVLGAARELERSLAGLLGLLDSRNASAQALDAAARSCSAGFEALRACIEAQQGAERSDLSGVLRANAIACDLAVRHHSELANAFERLRAVRRVVGRSSEDRQSGRSCDLAG